MRCFAGITSALVVHHLTSAVFAQLSGGVPGINIAQSPLNGTQLCNATFENVNATGIYTIDTQLVDASKITYALTVYQPNNTALETQLSVWFSTYGVNYVDDFALGYDVCYYWITQPYLNTFARGENDTGNCQTMLDTQCVDDFENLAASYTAAIVTNPSGDDLGANSLPGVCSAVASKLSTNFPASCTPYFNISQSYVTGAPPSLGGALTGNQSVLKNSYCDTFNANAGADSPSDATFTLLWTQYGANNYFNYALAHYFVSPFITVWSPIANAARPVTLSTSVAQMSCVRAKNITDGSLIPAPAPSPVPTSSSASSSATSSASSSASPSGSSMTSTSHGLSGGAIAGIVIGALAALAIGAVVLMRKRLRGGLFGRRGGERKDTLPTQHDGSRGNYAELDSLRTTRHEAPQRTYQPPAELHSPAEEQIRYAELSGWHEKGGFQTPMHAAELDSTTIGMDEDKR